MTRRRFSAAAAGLLIAGVGVGAGNGGAHATSPDTSVARPAATSVVSGGAEALVVTLNVLDANGKPQATLDKTATEVRDEAINTTRDWFVNTSHGVFSGYWAITGGTITVTTTQPVCSDKWLGEITTQATKTLKANLGLNTASYQAVVYYFGHIAPCLDDQNHLQWDGKGGGGSNAVFLNGTTRPSVVLHELGHNLGLGHAGSLTCSDGLVPLATGCVDDEYGDPFSAMGNLGTEPYSPDALARLGWNAGQLTEVTTSITTATYTLQASDIDAPGTTQALHLTDGATSLWLEYRPAAATFGYDGGLLVRTSAPPGHPDQTSSLLAMNYVFRPADRWAHPGMDVGQVWTDPLGTMTITLNSADATAARVTIQTTPVLKSVPDIRGLTTAAATDRLAAAGFQAGRIGTTVDWTCSHIDVVISQSPAAGTPEPAGRRVDFNYGIEPSGPPGTPLPC